jgi:hypothetical protein
MWRGIAFIVVFIILLLPGTVSAQQILPDGLNVDVNIVWQSLKPATCMPDRCFCEVIQPRIIRQPVNTWSNLAFVLVGILIFFTAIDDLYLHHSPQNTNPMQTKWVYPVTYGLVATSIGAGSMFYHLSLSFAGQVVDILSMYLMALFMLFYNLSRPGWLKSKSFLTWYLLSNLLLGIIATIWPELRRPIFLLIVASVLASEFIVRRAYVSKLDMRWFAAALASLVTACLAWILDITGTLCQPTSFFQAHALWHIGMAAAVGFVFLYYRSEKVEEKDSRLMPAVN